MDFLEHHMNGVSHMLRQAGFNIPTDGVNPVLGLALLLLGLLFLFCRPSGDTGDKKGGSGDKGISRSSGSLLDVSVGLRNEERLSVPSVASMNSLASMTSTPVSEKVLSASEFRPFSVLKVTRVSHNTKLLRFEVPHGRSLGLSIGRHISVKAEVDGSKVVRAYTPCSKPCQLGYFDLLVKSYEHGKLSPHLHKLRPGSVLEIRGPVGRFQYVPNQYRRVGLIAGGTGLTPCLQVVRCVLEQPSPPGQPKDVTCFTLLFQNRSEEDVLLRETLDQLAADYPDRFRLLYFLSNPQGVFGTPSTGKGTGKGSENPSEHRGYISAEYVQSYLAPSQCEYVAVCGPSGFNDSVKQLLVGVGHVDAPAAGETQTQTPSIYTF
mmetsp:Transcript_1438/g.3349  ORF Transcript_1438/g.3349 Transcript_1438/m.3349 type:complete len:377 (+) Transcript_1438:193-1323(+)|eukprot:CAMPEP_0173205248 /NCGR_PEP_ID=MMETSP1141-20130122/20630_1 /TAXON_ID=483371 /ORGANISM="non described non described, Strain CCMP2298" /LENGTH=376 /DNA_ID=CAMNT_0014131117 /DNA_START=154 /DNA_END=1284 /DNA_ORIENTATION=+